MKIDRANMDEEILTSMRACVWPEHRGKLSRELQDELAALRDKIKVMSTTAPAGPLDRALILSRAQGSLDVTFVATRSALDGLVEKRLSREAMQPDVTRLRALWVKVCCLAQRARLHAWASTRLGP